MTVGGITTAHEQARVSELAADVASRLEGARAAVVFGSYARGTAVAPLSDVDVLIWVEDRRAARGVRDLVNEHSGGCTGAELSVLVHDTDSLGDLSSRDWSFISHLRAEQIPVWGDVEGLRTRLRAPTPSATVIREEIACHRQAVSRLADHRLLGGEHLHAYAGLFGALKSASILDGIVSGEPVFDRHEAIESAAARLPELAAEFGELGALEPFWLRLRRRSPVMLPWRPRHDRDRLVDRLATATKVLDTLARQR